MLLYALGALPWGEARAVRAHLPSCADCRRTMDALRPVIDAFASWPTDVLRPRIAVWNRLAQRLAAESGGLPLPSTAPWVEPQWTDVAPGITCKILARDAESHRVSMLVRLAPGTDYPPHRHNDVEEVHILEGELLIDGNTYYPGDYRRAEADTVDPRVWTETGCTCVLTTSSRDAIL